MKIKEYPPSFWKLLKLSFKNPDYLNKSTPNDCDIIVSCTSIPSRLGVVHHTVKSILSQSTPPKKMVLWLHESARNRLPTKLKRLTGKKFEIRFTQLDSPHCKLIPSLSDFKEETIVTCDDDLLYDSTWLERLWKKHQDYPASIIAYRVRQMAFNENGQIKAYRDWKYDSTTELCNKRHIAMGYGGVLYPPRSLPDTAQDSEQYMKLCPKADDLWFKAMSYLSNTQIIAINDKISINPIPGSQKISLKKSNVKEDKNRDQWIALSNHFKGLNNISKRDN